MVGSSVPVPAAVAVVVIAATVPATVGGRSWSQRSLIFEDRLVMAVQLPRAGRS